MFNFDFPISEVNFLLLSAALASFIAKITTFHLQHFEFPVIYTTKIVGHVDNKFKSLKSYKRKKLLQKQNLFQKILYRRLVDGSGISIFYFIQ